MQDGGWIGLCSLAVTGFLGVLTLLINRRYDRKTTDLENTNKGQAVQINALIAEGQACREGRARDLAELDRVKKDLAARDATDKADLQSQINDLKKQVGGGT